MAVYITGDTHGEFGRFSRERFQEQKELTKYDTVIILGDFGGIWLPQESPEENYWLNWLNDKPFTTCYVDGNHENYTRYYSDEFPTVDYHGGKAHQIRDTVFHLQRGNVFEFDGKKFFAFGGAQSHDIRDGIFDFGKYPSHYTAKRELNRWYFEGKQFRILGFSWWPEELPSQDEMNFGRKTLEENDFKVDYVITHCLPQSVAVAGGWRDSDVLTNYFDELLENGLQFTRWYCGHYHQETSIWGKFIIKYHGIERIV